MIKITLKNAQLLEKAKILIDNKVIDKVGISKPTILDVEKGKHTLQLKGLSGKSIPIEIEVSDTTLEFNYDVNFEKIAKEGYFKLISSNNVNIDTSSNITNNSIDNEDYMYCNKCGTKLSKESAFCNKCGNKIEQVNNNTIKESTKTQNSTTVTNQSKVNITNGNTTTKNKNNIIGFVAGIILIIGVIFFALSGSGSNDRTTDLDGTYTRKTALTSYTLVIKDGKATFSEDGVGKIQTYNVKKGSVEYHFYKGNEKELFANYNELTNTLNIRGIIRDKNGKGVLGQSGNLDGTGGSNWIKK